MAGKWTAATVSLLAVSGAVSASPSFNPTTIPSAEQSGMVRQPDLTTIVRGTPRGGLRTLPVLLWLADSSFAGPKSGHAFADVDPLSEGGLQDFPAPTQPPAVPLETALAPEVPLAPTGYTVYYRETAPRGPDPSSGPVLIPLPPAVATGLITLGGAMLIAVRRQLRRRG